MIIINHGSGPIEGATEEHATANIQQYLDRCAVRFAWLLVGTLYGLVVASYVQN